jgi:hypothetical protein
MAKQDNTLYWLLGGAAALYLITRNPAATGAAVGAARKYVNDEFYHEGTQTNYKTTFIEAAGNVWGITVATGKFNYVSVLKETNNPFKTLGKQFANFDEAIANYKNPDLKVALFKLSAGL